MARSCIDADLLDKIMMFVAPVLPGDGARLFGYPGGRTIRLPVERPQFTGRTGMWFGCDSAECDSAEWDS